MAKRGVDREKVLQKIQMVRDRRRRLEEIRACGEERFLAEEDLQDIAVRSLQITIEALLDIANHVIAREALGVPTSHANSIEILVRNGILPQDKTGDFVRMVKFRNRAVHLYDEIDPPEVYSILEHHLEDFDVFLQGVVGRYV